MKGATFFSWRAHVNEQKLSRGRGPWTYSWDPLSGAVQLGLLGLQVVPERLLQCRTQHWNSSASTNTEVMWWWGVMEGKRGGEEEGREERRGGGIGGRRRHKSRHIIVTHQPKGSNKGREACCPLSCPVSVSAASSRWGEEAAESNEFDPSTAHPHNHTTGYK